VTISKFVSPVPSIFLSPSSPSSIRRLIPFSSIFFLLLTGCLIVKGDLSAAEAASTAVQISSLSCGETSMTGAGNDPCEVILTASAASGGFKVQLASNNASATFPTSSVTIAAGSTSLWFHVTTKAITAQKTVTLTASAGGITKAFTLTLKPVAVTTQPVTVSTLGIGSTSIAFGDVSLNSPSTQSLILNSTGSAAVTVSSIAVTGTGYSLAGLSLPLALQPGKSATLDVQFDPKTSGAATGKLTIASNSSAGASIAVPLTGTGVASSYKVSLSWNPPTGSEVEITGYRVYRAAADSAYQLLNSSIDTTTSYVDSTVDSGTAYDYYVESVDSAGASSTPSSVVAVTVP
jgi:hypothetical protein